MSKGVLATLTWKVKPELAEACIEALKGMFPTTSLKQGFRSIRLLTSETEANELMMVQEWDSVLDHQNYLNFRVETGEMPALMAMAVSLPQISYWSLEPLAEATL